MPVQKWQLIKAVMEYISPDKNDEFFVSYILSKYNLSVVEDFFGEFPKALKEMIADYLSDNADLPLLRR